MKYYAIIVGGGSGKRMQHSMPKQFLLLQNKPIIMHTIAVFALSSFQPKIIIVLPEDLHEFWKELCKKYNFNIPHQLITGGEQRFHSVRNGLMAINDEEGVVAIHDAVRPLVGVNLIDKTYQEAATKGNAIASIKLSDSVRRVLSEDESEIVDRDQLLLIQTPQTFQINQLTTAYQQSYQSNFTDDASVVELSGFKLNLIEGEKNNIKITYPEDLKLANYLLE